MVGLTWLTMGATTMWILSYCLAVLLALGACDAATVYAYSSGNNGAHLGPNNPSKNTIYSAAVKGGYDIGSYNAQAGSSGILMTVEKTGSDSSTRSQLQDSDVDSVGSGSLVYGTVGNAVNIGMSGYDVGPSTNVQGSKFLSSSSVLLPLQQSSYSLTSPVLLTAQVQTSPQSNSQQPASSGTMAQSSRLQISQSSDQQLPQPSSQSAVHASRLPHKPLRGKPHQSGSNTVFGSRPVQNPLFNSSKPLKPKKESASHSSLQILQYGSVPNSLAVASYELASQSSGQTVNQPSGVQPPHVIDLSVQPSSQVIQQAVDTSVAQVSSQQLVQTSQSLSQLNDQQPLHGSSVFAAQPSGLTFLKPHKSRHQFGSKPPSSTSLDTPSLNIAAQSTSQIPVQTSYQFGPHPALQLPVQASYQSEAQSASHTLGQTSYLPVPQIVVQPAQISYQSASQASVPQPVHPSYQSVAQLTAPQASYQSVSQSNGKQLVQASYQSEAQPERISYQFVAKPSVQQPAEVSFSIAPPALQPVQPTYQWVAQLGLQQPAHVGFSVAQPISQQVGQSTYEYVVEPIGQPLFKPAHSNGLHQIDSKLYSCQELPQHGYQRRFQSPSRTSLLALARHTKPVVSSSNQIPAKPNHPRPHTSTLQSILTPAQVLSSQQYLYQPVYTPQATLVEPMYQPLAQTSSETVSLAEYQIAPVPVQLVSQPHMLPSSQSLTQSSSSSGMPVQSSYKPLVQSSYETVLQPGFQTTVLVPSSYHSTSSQDLSGPVVLNHESAFQPVQPELTIPLQVDYHSVTGQNTPGPAQNGYLSQKLFRWLQQVKS